MEGYARTLSFICKFLKTNYKLSTNLFKINKLNMRSSFIFCKQDTVPWRPFLVFIPAYKCQIIQIFPGTQYTLTTPDLLHQIT